MTDDQQATLPVQFCAHPFQCMGAGGVDMLDTLQVQHHMDNPVIH
jgi:hypothetical protein